MQASVAERVIAGLIVASQGEELYDFTDAAKHDFTDTAKQSDHKLQSSNTKQAIHTITHSSTVTLTHLPITLLENNRICHPTS